jgi:hypothetical protein
LIIAMAEITRTFCIPDEKPDTPALAIKIYEPSLTEDNLGLKTWASSYLLAKRLSTLARTHRVLHQLRESSKSSGFGILELGSGTGLVGLAAAAVLSCPVVLTDLPSIVPNLRTNIENNSAIVVAHGGSPRAEILNWETYEKDIRTWSEYH